jgi:hypothetical protein
VLVDNILVGLEGDVKLADFGTAVQLTFQRLHRTTLVGTPYYMVQIKSFVDLTKPHVLGT